MRHFPMTFFAWRQALAGRRVFRVLSPLLLVVVASALPASAQGPSPGGRPSSMPPDFPKPLFDRELLRNNQRLIDIHFTNNAFATNFITGTVSIGSEKPKQMAVLVMVAPGTPPLPVFGAMKDPKQMEAFFNKLRSDAIARSASLSPDWSKAAWMPFAETVSVDLGPGDGRRAVWIAGNWEASPGQCQAATAAHIRVDHAPPVVVITSPKDGLLSVPMVQLRGYSEEPLSKIRYDVLNATHSRMDEEGFVTSVGFDPTAFEATTNFIAGFDIDLDPGTNTIVLRCTDNAGNVATNRLTCVFSLEHDRTPPVIALGWPIDGESVASPAFTLRGTLDDATASVAGIICSGDRTNVVAGLVERTGVFWIEDMPLVGETNRLTVIATDAAGNSSTTNITLTKSDLLLSMDPLKPDQSWARKVALTGKISDQNHNLWVNGVLATVRLDGTWAAANVPNTNVGGTALFTMSAVPKVTRKAVPPATQELVTVQADLRTNGLALNLSMPACGQFNLHLDGVAGRGFVVWASTNLASWTPILTNLSQADFFECKFTNDAGLPCRFFRVTPSP